MTYVEVFELIDAGQGRWEVRNRTTAMSAGQVWRVGRGFELRDWRDHRRGSFRSIDAALRELLRASR
jgi:hypothetical protein